MNIRPFQLERYFARYEFKVQYLLSPSDCESLAVDDLLSMASTASLEMWYSLRLSYTESPGHPALRGAVERLYATIDADEVMIAAPEEAIFLADRVLVLPKEKGAMPRLIEVAAEHPAVNGRATITTPAEAGYGPASLL